MKFCPQCGSSYEETVKFCHRDGEVLEESPANMVGEVLDGQYEIEAFIARGGMGTLYRARHILLGDRVVIKTLRSEMRHNTEWLRRFQREGRAARRFRHPNSVTVYDLRSTDAGLIYMVMEFVEGETLDKELKRRARFTPEEALEVIEPVASVLEAAHAQGVVHRDLKPENVMISRGSDGRAVVKLLDLGIAKLRDVAETQVGDGGGGGLTIAGQILGTPYYMSPEQWGEMPRDQNPEIDGRADIYSLGVMFYELITGQKPLTGRSLPELRHAHVNQQVASLKEVAPDVPEAYSRAVEHAMAKDRGDRPQTAGELADEVRASLGLPPMARISYTPSIASGTNLELARSVPGHDSGSVSADQSLGGAAAAAVAPVPAGGVRTKASQGNHSTNPGRNDSIITVTAGGRLAAASTAARSSANPSISHAGQPEATAVPPAPARGSGVALIAAGVALILLLTAGVGVGGWYLWQRWQARMIEAGPTNGPDAPNTNAANSNAPVERVEVVTYWLESFGRTRTGKGTRVAGNGDLSLASGQQFKFHFSPRERGYFYIVGPGDGNAPMTFLTAQPLGIMKTNQAAGRADFIFPYGKDRNGEEYVLQLDQNPGTEEYTVIFSPTPLLSPSFLADKAGHQLTPAELKEWEDFRAQYKTATPSVDVKSNAEGGPVVAVSVPAAGASGQPIFFDIRIVHK
ncbi:MAG: protein kinase domain-containing protein [Pyrinomonadaceae bacterium]